MKDCLCDRVSREYSIYSTNRATVITGNKHSIQHIVMLFLK